MASSSTKSTAKTASTSAATILLFNPWDTPCVYTDDGRTLGGGERLWVENVDATGRTAIANGYLVVKKGTLPPLAAVEEGAAETVGQGDPKPEAQDKTGESVPA